jgi:release factor glutamine methyltransferase
MRLWRRTARRNCHMSLVELLAAAERQLTQAGIVGARREAHWLWQHVSGMDGASVLVHGQVHVDEHLRRRFQELTARRAGREPLQYVTGECEFDGLSLFVDRRVLIPRPETVRLVDLALAALRRWRGATLADHAPGTAGGVAPLAIVDVGTGSGAIIIALARRLQRAGWSGECRLVGTDVSPSALAVARMNARRSGVERLISFACGDLLQAVQDSPPFHMIVCNPPYIDPVDLEQLQPEVRDYEPRLALVAENRGLALYDRLFGQAAAFLVGGGDVLVEVGKGQADAVAAVARRHLPIADVTVRCDFRGIERVVTARLADAAHLQGV